MHGQLQTHFILNIMIKSGAFLFITIAYFVFLKAAYEILYISKSFGFEGKAAEISKIIQSKKRSKKSR